ncbi:hypothetical protein niasHT_012198 [Heterodera trifolii]|uniref:Uncharacterized protein n=1 Tax=Heterodera trifolii TaxID=157864 RepID=A0ABD2KUG0_9BILA
MLRNTNGALKINGFDEATNCCVDIGAITITSTVNLVNTAPTTSIATSNTTKLGICITAITITTAATINLVNTPPTTSITTTNTTKFDICIPDITITTAATINLVNTPPTTLITTTNTTKLGTCITAIITPQQQQLTSPVLHHQQQQHRPQQFSDSQGMLTRHLIIDEDEETETQQHQNQQYSPISDSPLEGVPPPDNDTQITGLMTSFLNRIPSSSGSSTSNTSKSGHELRKHVGSVRLFVVVVAAAPSILRFLQNLGLFLHFLPPTPAVAPSTRQTTSISVDFRVLFAVVFLVAAAQPHVVNELHP